MTADDPTHPSDPLLGEPTLPREVSRQGASAAEELVALNAALSPADGSPPRYVAVERLGQGGMGAVYKAEQRAARPGDLGRQHVAIKVIALGMNSRQVVARFEAERQALALMSHPNIAAVFDAGLLRDGRPFFVMEYIRGRPITDFADAQRLGVPARLRLFQQVCEAIRHAHQRAVIHRDVKPANIMAYMDGDVPRAKVVDFGIAKAVGGRLTNQTVNTQASEAIGTYSYMSPEQADGSPDIDTRTDVYSLGATLYELLAGVVPLDLARATDEVVRRMIRDQDPPNPSTRLSSLGDSATEIARRRGAGLRELVHQLSGELGWIVLKALKKSRAERYADPAALSADIDNLLAGRPLSAGPDSAVYRLRKFVRRRRGPVIAAALVALAASAGVAVYVMNINAERSRTAAALVEVTRQKGEADAQRTKAVEERDSAKAVLGFLTDRVLNGATPASIPDRAVRDQIVRAMLDPAIAAVDKDFKDRPLIEAAVRNAISVTLDQLGRSDLALVHYERSYALYKEHLPPDNIERLESQSNYAYILWRMHRSKEAEPIFRDVLARRTRVLGPEHPDTIMTVNNIASALDSQGRRLEALPLYKDAADRHARARGPDDPDTLLAETNYARALRSLGRAGEAESHFKNVVDRRIRLFGLDHPDTLYTQGQYVRALRDLGRSAEAEAILYGALERSRRVMGEDDFLTMDLQSQLADVIIAQGRAAEGAEILKRAWESITRLRGPDHRMAVTALSNYGIALKQMSRIKEADPLLKEALGRSERVLGDEHEDTLMMRTHYAMVLTTLGRAAEAEPHYRKLAEGSERSLGVEHPNAITLAVRHANILQGLGRAAEAEPIFARAVEHAAASPQVGRFHPSTRAIAEAHAKCLESLNRAADAAAVRERFKLKRAAAVEPGVKEPSTK